MCLLVSFSQAQQLPNLSSGKLTRIENFQSKYVEARHVDVWLPDGYDASKRYTTVYMHDGQMLFDSTQTWNRKEWGVDETFSQLASQGKIDRCIIVAVWNTGSNRISEYLPNKIFNQLEPKTQASFSEKYTNGKGAGGDNYLKFLVEELKPYIDLHFSTYPDKEHTFVMGSSLGATISLYAINEYPEVFGGAACLSTAWLSSIEPGYEIPAATFEYLKKHLATPFGHKIYMDYGTGESDRNYELTQSFVDLIAKGKGYSEVNYVSKVFEKAEHNEIAWRKRLYLPIEFLVGSIPDQKVTSGRIEKYKDFPSKFVTERNIEVWLPEGYSPKKRYAVLYMHDGQMLFDSTTAWNKQSWNVEEVASKLMMEQKMQQFIVVGIWNGGKTRHADYFPQKPFDNMSVEKKEQVIKQLQGTGGSKDTFQPVSDNYLKFMVAELKPYIDKHYPVFTDRNHTFVAGSSMGGLISLYAICEYPKIFGGAACLSTHWPGTFSAENNPVPEAFINYMKTKLPDPETHKIYFDYGDQTLDAMYPPLQKRVDEVMTSKGFTRKSWITKFYPGADHSERAWNKRLDVPFFFMLGTEKP